MSSLRLVPASMANIPIDWTRVPEASMKKLAKWGHDWENEVMVTKPLPKTFGDLAKWFDESKFFGYFGPELCTLIMDFSEFAFQAASNQTGPRFYMKYREQIWFLLFTPGKRNCIMGHSDNIAHEGEDDSEYERWAAEEVVLAEKFDARLERDVLEGKAGMVEFTQKLAGWNAHTLESYLETGQLGDAMISLPMSHPARKAFISSMLSGRFR